MNLLLIKESLLFALSFLTRIPFVKRDHLYLSSNLIKASFSWFPFVGFLYGAFIAAFALFLLSIEVNIFVVATLILAAPLFLSGFLHFDGLLDCMDAFFCDKPIYRRLEIMKESTIGSFALAGGLLFLLLKWSFLQASLNRTTLAWLIVVPLLSRAQVVFLAATSASPRNEGLANSFLGALPKGVVLSVSLSLFLLLCFCAFLLIRGQNFSTVIFKLVLFVVVQMALTFLVRLYSYKKIGGVTGDTLGASIELSELVLISLIAV